MLVVGLIMVVLGLLSMWGVAQFFVFGFEEYHTVNPGASTDRGQLSIILPIVLTMFSSSVPVVLGWLMVVFIMRKQELKT